MARCAEEAEKATQELLALESQLAELGDAQKANGKSVLLKMADGQDSALRHSVFSSWHGLVIKTKAESEIRQRFEGAIKHLDDQFFEYKAKQIENIRGVMARMCYEEDEAVLRDALATWRLEVKKIQDEGNTAEELRKIQDKLAQFENEAAENAKKVMARMAGNCSSALQQCVSR